MHKKHYLLVPNQAHFVVNILFSPVSKENQNDSCINCPRTFSRQGGPSTEELVADATRSSVSVPFFQAVQPLTGLCCPQKREVLKPQERRGAMTRQKDPNGSTTRPRGRSWFGWSPLTVIINRRQLPAGPPGLQRACPVSRYSKQL